MEMDHLNHGGKSGINTACFPCCWPGALKPQCSEIAATTITIQYFRPLQNPCVPLQSALLYADQRRAERSGTGTASKHSDADDQFP